MDKIIKNALAVVKTIIEESKEKKLAAGRDEMIKRFLQKEGNVLYSPATMQLALCILGYITTGKSKQEVLQVLGVDEEGLIKLANELTDTFNKSDFVDSGWVYINKDSENTLTKETVCTLASSLWLNEECEYNEEKLADLKKTIDTDAFIGNASTEKFNSELQEWLNNKTNNMLAESVSNIKLPEDLVLAIFSALYFKAKWDILKFDKKDTKKDKFYTSVGGYITTDFMNTEFQTYVHRGEKYTGVSLPLKGGFNINFLLPNEGTKPRELLENKEAMAYLSQENIEDFGRFTVELKIPRFDIKANIDLLNTLKELGFKNLVDEYNGDFTELCQEPVYISDGKQLNRMIVKEEGVEVASITGFWMKCCLSVAPPKIKFTLDRPFLVSVTGEGSNIPLMVGIIEEPNH